MSIMKINKNQLLERLSKGESISEIIDSSLNIIGGDDEATSLIDVTSNSTTDSHIDAVTQQNGKDRFNSVQGVGVTALANVVLETEIDDSVNNVKNEIIKKISENDVNSNKEIPSLESLINNYPIVGRNLEVLIDSIKRREVDSISDSIILNELISNIDIENLPDNYKNIIKNKF